ncbi:MAG: hypothetical protein M9929_03940 [Burkholderiaceae bacterium]|nr:hypothetical protein [Burkholderiaceae bacterium]
MRVLHTPGPWRAEYTNDARLSKVVVAAESANGSTAVIGQCAGPDKESNARLIAAAPDLLTALWNLRRCMLAQDMANGAVRFSEEEYGACMAAARAAIAKATGQEGGAA